VVLCTGIILIPCLKAYFGLIITLLFVFDTHCNLVIMGAVCFDGVVYTADLRGLL